jgi:hypothetical protein
MNQTYRQIIIGMALYVAIMLSMLAGVIVLFSRDFDFIMASTTGWLLPLSWQTQVMCFALALLVFYNFVSVLSQIASAVAGFFSGAKTI